MARSMPSIANTFPRRAVLGEPRFFKPKMNSVAANK